MQEPMPTSGSSTNPGVLVPGNQGSANALTLPAVTDPTALVNDITKALNIPPTLVETVSTYVGTLVAVAGFVVGAFDQPLGLSISSVPQATIMAASVVIAGAIVVFHLLTKTQKQKAAAQLAGRLHGNLMVASRGL